ncbi:NADP-dependent alcohol dehydrogenase [Hyphodiscus hymeniophilus]|uniref:NADP-dependent alcohol dehydrogenase n=1 Tax=Hyphodiscus hymeniophilus TaxID=353542 RepID=A0A9P6VH44_9HELO|nr:NADP-dependent alcohol dehydrogenase [Hyphodiscus hymeniophilus]
MAISRQETKRADALALGADSYVATTDETDWATHYAGSLDLIISTVSTAEMPLNAYLGLLRTGGRFCQIGLPENPLPPLETFGLIERKISIHFNDVGSIPEVEELLAFVVEKKIQPWVETRKIGDINKVLVEMEAGKARFRYVFVNEV